MRARFRLDLRSIKSKLFISMAALAFVPAIVVSVFAYRSCRDGLIDETGNRLQTLAEETIDKVDRNLFERYGDVQAFAANPMALGTVEQLIDAANLYTRLYGIYDLMIIADVDGTILAANTRTFDDKPLDTKPLVGRSVRGEPWFEAIASGQVKQGTTFFSDVEQNERIAQLLNSRGMALNFTAPIVDDTGKVVRIWANWASWDRIVGEIMTNQLTALAGKGYQSMESQVLSKDGRLLYDSNPQSKIMQSNLATDGVNAAKSSVAGTRGFTRENNLAKVPQIIGYSASKGALGFAGYGWGVLVRQNEYDSYQVARSLRNLVIVIMTVAALVVAAVGFVLVTAICRPLIRTAAVVETIAAGDFTQRVPVTTHDEVGAVGRSVNALADNLQQLVRQLHVSSGSLGDSSDQLAGTAKELTLGVQTATQQSATVAAAAEEMSTNMRTMAASTEQMSANVRNVAEAINEMTASVAEIARNAERSSGNAGKAAQLADQSNEKVRQLGIAADQIGKVIDVIQDIADQTNLLALNATIEAARAGEAGKGFAVVATEVKELAKQSAAATDSIRLQIQGIQSSTGETVLSIAEISGAIRAVNEVAQSIAAAVEEQSIATKEISRNVAETSTAATTVSRGVTESASACQEIAKSITLVDQAARQTAGGASKTEQVGQQMHSLANELQSLVSKYQA